MKVFLISHIADADGVTPVVLTDLAFDEYDYHLLEPGDVDDYILECIDNNKFDEYDLVLVTDLCFTEVAAQVIDKIDLKNKIQVLDHHQSRLDLNKYEFVHVEVERDGKKVSGTSLYHEYLLNHYPNDILRKESVSELVDLVRSGDTWEWKATNRLEARDVATLLAYYGNDGYIKKYSKFLRENDTFYFDEMDKTLIEIDRRRIQEYIEDCKSKVIFTEMKGYKVGVIFAELYRSELGNDLAEYYKDKVDFIMIVNMNRSISFRSIRDDINLGEFASCLDGFGHFKSAGAKLPEGIKENTLEYILKKMK